MKPRTLTSEVLPALLLVLGALAIPFACDLLGVLWSAVKAAS